MSMVTYPLNNIEYTAEDAELFHSTRTSGVYATDSFDYSVTGADNSIVIGTGIAWIKNRQFSGKVVAQKEPMSLDMGLPDPTYPRIDAVVIQFNSNKNATEIVVKNGAASSFPIAPEVVRTESLYELHLYHVRREAGSLSISAPNITDLRNNNAYCGLMSDSITQAVDSTLSKNGVAADAAAVGNALTNKAPAGYGLGGNAATLYGSALDITASGWYYYTQAQGFSTDVPSYEGLILASVGPYSTHLDAFPLSGSTQAGCHATLTKNWHTWDEEWEWENPPMELGVEYRTTERWNGKAVYKYNGTYAITTALSGTQALEIPTGISNMDTCFKCEARLGPYYLPFVSGSGDTTINDVTNGVINLVNHGPHWGAGYVLSFTFYYTKG